MVWLYIYIGISLLNIHMCHIGIWYTLYWYNGHSRPENTKCIILIATLGIHPLTHNLNRTLMISGRLRFKQSRCLKWKDGRLFCNKCHVNDDITHRFETMRTYAYAWWIFSAAYTFGIDKLSPKMITRFLSDNLVVEIKLFHTYLALCRMRVYPFLHQNKAKWSFYEWAEYVILAANPTKSFSSTLVSWQ